jgi:LmbE family N-acetylglucosaminyl deacetylase
VGVQAGVSPIGRVMTEKAAPTPQPPAPSPQGGGEHSLFGRRILILAPHPDDEVVGCCAAIGRAKARGAELSVLFLTHGSIEAAAMWPWARAGYPSVVARRRAEAEQAAERLGLSIAGWSDRPARRLWRELGEAEAEARRALAATGADQIWAPAFEGGNPDHDGANALASRFVAEGVSVLEFAEYNLAGGRANSHRFPHPTGAETPLTLSPQEQAAKRACLALYRSEKANLAYVRTRREVFRPLARYDYAAPPHPGGLWYARFQWVPLRHPRVDYTRPAEVADALAGYLAAGASVVNGSLTIRAEARQRLP